MKAGIHITYRNRNYIFRYFHLRSPGVLILYSSLLFSLTMCRTIPKKTATQVPPAQKAAKGSICGHDSLWINFFADKQEINACLGMQLVSFYKNRYYTPVWINSSGINENAGNFLDLLDDEKIFSTRCSVSSLNELRELYRKVLKDTSARMYCQDSLAMKLEVLLTRNFFEFAARNWQGADNDVLKQVNWYVTRKQIDYGQFLNNYLNSKQDFSFKEPVYKQYTLLKNYLKKYNEMELNGVWQPMPGECKTLRKGDTSEAVTLIKHQLYTEGDLTEIDTGKVFNDQLESGVRKFQQRHGLPDDGIIGKKTLLAMQVTLQDRKRQILLNMERCRWIPREFTGDYLIINIPEFRLHAYKNDTLKWSSNVIVGKSNPVNSTVIFNDSIEFVVFNPYWNIPKNILSKETLPAIQKDREYMQRNNLEVLDKDRQIIESSVIDWNNCSEHFPYTIRQRPGKNNSLGSVKFLFPNPYDIYIHDTPAKTLFGESSRAFSHGCIRLEDPARLAEFLLCSDNSWTRERIVSMMSEDKEIFVKLKKKVPVYIVYFTSWVDQGRKLNFRDDVYGYDARLKKLLFVN